MKAKIFATIAILALLIISCKTVEVNIVKQSTVENMTYSYVDIDPVTVGTTWTQITTVPINQFMAEIYFQNPDKEAPIQFATLVVSPAGIGGYSYYVNGNIYVCAFNEEKNAYENIWDTLDPESQAQWKDDYKTYFGLTKS